ncbi:MAG TPA: ribosome biogenesis GTPase Der [Alphaproteobacteria bacterium]|nr:ribosome biogenesis GTPase Der [Alphaproteobacteria bacterium]
MTYTVAIVGRPNVGKSTLYNRLVGKREALVDDAPGLTRDRREGEASLGGLAFTAIDTAGLEEADADTLEAKMLAQSERAVADADLVLFLFDARAGITPLDRHFAALLRRSGKPLALIANKCEGKGGEAGLVDAYALGLGEPIPISAQHGEGLSDLYDVIAAHAPPEDASVEDSEGERALRLAIVGRPNVGKSTLINRLVGEERVLTGPEPGVTRDAISIDWSYEDRAIALFDTAGLRRRARIDDRMEKLSAGDAIRAVKFAHCVILMIDATEIEPNTGSLHKQDLTIARIVIEEGRALVVAANKWDAVEDRARVRARIAESIEDSMGQARGVPIVHITALDGTGVAKLMAAVFAVDARWNKHLPTAALNRWLSDMIERHPPPMAKGRRLRLRYLTQVNTRPPSFAIFVSRPVELPGAYRRYLVNGLRDAFGLDGVPIRLMMRKGKNPYAEDER